MSRIVSLISEHFSRFVFKNKLMAFNESIHEHSCFKRVRSQQEMFLH